MSFWKKKTLSIDDIKPQLFTVHSNESDLFKLDFRKSSDLNHFFSSIDQYMKDAEYRNAQTSYNQWGITRRYFFVKDQKVVSNLELILMNRDIHNNNTTEILESVRNLFTRIKLYNETSSSEHIKEEVQLL